MGSFRNVIVCEDLREELGNKKSLMGIFTGDIVVSQFPATVPLAFYIEYMPDKSDTDEISFEFRLMQDDAEMAKGIAAAPLAPSQVAVIVLPRGLGTFDKECNFRLLVSVAGSSETEIVSKRIIKGVVISSTIAPAQP